METFDLLHLRGSKAGLRKARCVRNCMSGKGRWKRGKHTKKRCRRACGVKAK